LNKKKILHALDVSNANRASLNTNQELNNFALAKNFSLNEAPKELAGFAWCMLEHISKEGLQAHKHKQAEDKNKHLLNTCSMINAVPKGDKNSIYLDSASKNTRSRNTVTMCHKPEVLLPVL
jgi:homospermidine synthase